MYNISSFLKKFKNFVPKNKAIKKEFIEILKQQTNINIFDQDVQIQGSIVYLDISPQAKSEVYMKKGKIFKALSERLPNIKINKIL